MTSNSYYGWGNVGGTWHGSYNASTFSNPQQESSWNAATLPAAHQSLVATQPDAIPHNGPWSTPYLYQPPYVFGTSYQQQQAPAMGSWNQHAASPYLPQPASVFTTPFQPFVAPQTDGLPRTGLWGTHPITAQPYQATNTLPTPYQPQQALPANSFIPQVAAIDRNQTARATPASYPCLYQDCT